MVRSTTQRKVPRPERGWLVEEKPGSFTLPAPEPDA
jgi:hypothetical protein